jgi:hypothetical protein
MSCRSEYPKPIKINIAKHQKNSHNHCFIDIKQDMGSEEAFSFGKGLRTAQML